MAAFAAHKPASQHAILHKVHTGNPERGGAAEWTETQLAKGCSELTGQPCMRQTVGKVLRTKLLPKGVVAMRKAGHTLVLWSPTAEARTLRL
jgi:hypothetical protein